MQLQVSANHLSSPSVAEGDRILIVNADDFGLSEGVNEGIVHCHKQGIVTSASLMVRGAAAAEAADMAGNHPELGVGLHVDLGEWVCQAGVWRAIYEVVPVEDSAAVEIELRRQLDRFRELMGREPTHLDSHQHVHRSEPVRRLVCQLGCELQVAVRHFAPGIRFCGDFYGQTGDGQALPNSITSARLVELIASLSRGVTELACHPGYADELNTMYRLERRQEIDALCSESVRRAIADTATGLRSFSQSVSSEIPG